LNYFIEVGQLAYGAAGSAYLEECCGIVAPAMTRPKPKARSTVRRRCPPDEGLVLRDITLLRPRALLARARGDDVAYRDLVIRYLAMAESLGYQGHIAWAETMIEDGPQSPIA
jgi:hypothetical protein